MYIWLVNLLKHNSNIQESLVLFRTSCSTGWFRSKMTPPSGFNCAGRKHSHLIFYGLFPLEVLHGVIHISKPVNPAFWSRQDTSWPTLSTTPSFLDPSSGDFHYHNRDFHYHHRMYVQSPHCPLLWSWLGCFRRDQTQPTPSALLVRSSRDRSGTWIEYFSKTIIVCLFICLCHVGFGMSGSKTLKCGWPWQLATYLS